MTTVSLPPGSADSPAHTGPQASINYKELKPTPAKCPPQRLSGVRGSEQLEAHPAIGGSVSGTSGIPSDTGPRPGTGTRSQQGWAPVTHRYAGPGAREPSPQHPTHQAPACAAHADRREPRGDRLPTLASRCPLTPTNAQPLWEKGVSGHRLVCLPSLCLGVFLKKRLSFQGTVA